VKQEKKLLLSSKVAKRPLEIAISSQKAAIHSQRLLHTLKAAALKAKLSELQESQSWYQVSSLHVDEVPALVQKIVTADTHILKLYKTFQSAAMKSTHHRSKRSRSQYEAQISPPVSNVNGNAEYPNKRRKLSPQRSGSIEDTYMSGEAGLVTPPSSATPETMSLKLIIPHKQLTKENHRTLAVREAAAKRWIPKLQKPFPKGKEITEAYKLKLMRHYPSPGTCSVTSPAPFSKNSPIRFQNTSPATYWEPNFVKPPIDYSPRVTELLKRFPKVYTSDPGLQAPASGSASITYTTPTEIEFIGSTIQALRRNRALTRHESVKRLAWQCFSATERDRTDRGREAMMISGLDEDDLRKEKRGLPNELPEWRKQHTSKFVVHDRIHRWRLGCSPSNGEGRAA
jgi:hypothetical protein